MSGEDKSLLERVEMPTIPKDAQKQIAILEEQFDRAQVEQRKLNLPYHLTPLFLSWCEPSRWKANCRRRMR